MKLTHSVYIVIQANGFHHALSMAYHALYTRRAALPAFQAVHHIYHRTQANTPDRPFRLSYPTIRP